MNKFLNSLSFKVGAIIILVEMIVLTALGFVYINRFSHQVDMQIETQAQLPGLLMNAGLLSFDSVSDPTTMRELVGDEVISGMVVGVNGVVFYSLDPSLLGMDVAEVPGVDAGLFEIDNLQDVVIHNPERVIAVSPIYAADQRTPRFFVYTEISKLGATAEKTDLTNLFVIGSLATMLLTSLVILFSFNQVILKRLSNLVGILKRFETGDLTIRVQNPNSPDEIGVLQRSTNTAIEARQQSTDLVIHLNRILRAIRNVNQLITQERDLDRLLESACERLTETASYASAWILLLNEDGTPSKFSRSDLAGDAFSLADLLEQDELRACIQRVLDQPEVQVFDNASYLCQNCFMFKKRGPYNALATRLEYEGEIYGVLNVTVLTEYSIDAEEISLFEELAGDISFALYSIGLEAERVTVEEALKESERNLQKILTTVPLGIGLIIDRKLGWSNERMYEMVGYPDGRLIGKSTKTLYENEDEYNRVDKIVYEMMSEKRIGEVETQWKRKDNSIFDCLIRLAPLNLSNPSEGNIAVISDITERKRAEGELLKYQQQLELLVKERTTDLDQRIVEMEKLNNAMVNLLEDLQESNLNLEKTSQQLEVANKELESFSYSVSHDLRAPLRAIDGFTNILMENYASKLDDEGKRLGSVLQQSARKMGQLIDDLLAFSRLGRSAMNFSEIEMKKMAKAVYQEETDPKARKRITFTIADLPNVDGDSAMMRQLWTNLISNALKFSAHQKKALISVSCQEEEEQLIFCIKDNGAGFNMKYKDKLFTVFQRLHSDKEFAGTGVGLALVQQIINRHGGEVWAEGEVDRGAAVYFSLPGKRRA